MGNETSGSRRCSRWPLGWGVRHTSFSDSQVYRPDFDVAVTGDVGFVLGGLANEPLANVEDVRKGNLWTGGSGSIPARQKDCDRQLVKFNACRCLYEAGLKVRSGKQLPLSVALVQGAWNETAFLGPRCAGFGSDHRPLGGQRLKVGQQRPADGLAQIALLELCPALTSSWGDERGSSGLCS